MTPTLNNPVKPLDVFGLIFGRCRPDSLIAIGSRRPTKKPPFHEAPHALLAVPVRAMREWLPEVFSWHLEHTQYLCPNAIHPRAVIGSSVTEIGPHARARWFAASNDNVAELCALVVDLDCYKPPVSLDAAQALGVAVTMILKGVLPMPAMAAHSGRGAYLLWLLRDEGSDAPPPATPDNADTWKLVAEEIVRRTRDLGADPNARRLANWYKRPGTIDTKTGREVTYMTFGAGSPDAIPLHRLSALQAFLGVYHHQVDARDDEPPADAPEALPATVTVNSSYRSGRLPSDRRKRIAKPGRGGECARKRIGEIERLSAHRGGFREGVRAVAIWVYHISLRADLRTRSDGTMEGFQEANQEAVLRSCQFSRTFTPPLPRQEVLAQARKSGGGKDARYRFRAETIAQMLDVTPAEAEALGLNAIAPAGVREAARNAELNAKDARQRERQERRQQIEALIREGRTDSEIGRLLDVKRLQVWRTRKRMRGTRSCTSGTDMLGSTVCTRTCEVQAVSEPDRIA